MALSFDMIKLWNSIMITGTVIHRTCFLRWSHLCCCLVIHRFRRLRLLLPPFVFFLFLYEVITAAWWWQWQWRWQPPSSDIATARYRIAASTDLTTSVGHHGTAAERGSVGAQVRDARRSVAGQRRFAADRGTTAATPLTPLSLLLACHTRRHCDYWPTILDEVNSLLQLCWTAIMGLFSQKFHQKVSTIFLLIIIMLFIHTHKILHLHSVLAFTQQFVKI